MKQIFYKSLLLSSLLFNGCKIIPPAYLTKSYEELKKSDDVRQIRMKKSRSKSLEEKVNYFNRLIDKDLVKISEGVLIPTARYKTNKKPLQAEVNSAYLCALSFEYAVTKNKKTKLRAESILKGLIAMDKLDGFDGYIPYEINGNTKEVSKRETHANVYDQIFFAYYYMDKFLGKNKLIEKHISLIYNKWLMDDFELKKPNGEKSKYSNLKIKKTFSLNPSRSLERKLLDGIAYKLGNNETKQKVLKYGWKGKTSGKLYLNLGFLEIPTSSSSWLNMLDLKLLEELNLENNVRLKKLIKNYENQKNPFFQILLSLSNGKITNPLIKKRLSEFPCPCDGERIINSHRKEIKLRPRRFIKSTSKIESEIPLPLFEITSDHYLWKRNLLDIGRNSDSTVSEYYGIDFLQAYWMFRYLKLKSSF